MRSPLGRPVLVALVAALTFLGGAVGYTLGRGRPPAAASADVGFLQDMIAHHEQAVRMATTGDAAATETSVRHFAREVLIFQQYEIGLMEAYLKRWGHPRVSTRTTVMGWMGHPTAPEAMPGLATAAQLRELETATGRTVDSLFLKLMIEHHKGGVHMADEAVKRVRDREVRDLARRMRTNQRNEIVEYERAVTRLGL
jgi:uncharacterized protein (DUF305 family)